MAESPTRLWRGAFWAWLGMLIFVSLLALVLGPHDIDFGTGWDGRIEAVMAVWAFLPLPLGFMSFGALAPMGFVLNRLATSEIWWRRALIGLYLSLPTFIAFVVATKVPQRLGLLGSKRSTLLEDFSAISHRPAQALPFLVLFAVGGMIFMLTSRPTRRTPATATAE